MDAVEVADELRTMRAQLDRIERLLDEYEPVIRAYLAPGATGPGAWAVRRRTRKMGVSVNGHHED